MLFFCYFHANIFYNAFLTKRFFLYFLYTKSTFQERFNIARLLAFNKLRLSLSVFVISLCQFEQSITVESRELS